eukprot:1152133-Pelagomonas_calceolata.AAC.2
MCWLAVFAEFVAWTVFICTSWLAVFAEFAVQAGLACMRRQRLLRVQHTAHAPHLLAAPLSYCNAQSCALIILGHRPGQVRDGSKRKLTL